MNTIITVASVTINNWYSTCIFPTFLQLKKMIAYMHTVEMDAVKFSMVGKKIKHLLCFSLIQNVINIMDDFGSLQ